MKRFFVLLIVLFISSNSYATEFQINTYTTNSQLNSALAYDGTNYLVTWQSDGQDGSSAGVYGQLVSTSGVAVGSEFKINTHTANSQNTSALAFDGTNYLVTWQSDGQDGSGAGVYGQLVSTSGVSIGTEFQINTHTSNSQGDPALAYDGTNYLVTWHSDGQDGNSWGIYGQRISTSGVAVGTEFRVNTYTSSTQSNSALAYDGTNYLVTWQSDSQDGSGAGIYGQLVSTSGASVGGEFQVNSYTANAQGASALAFDGTNYLVTWQSDGQDGSSSGIYGQLVSTSGDFLGTEFLINTYTANEQGTPVLAFDGINYLVIWRSDGQDGSSYGIFGQWVSTSGELIDSEFQLNTYTTNIQANPALAYDGTNYLVTWHSYGQDGSDAGIYGDFVGTNDAIPEPFSFCLIGCAVLGLIMRKRYRLG